MQVNIQMVALPSSEEDPPTQWERSFHQALTQGLIYQPRRSCDQAVLAKSRDEPRSRGGFRRKKSGDQCTFALITTFDWRYIRNKEPVAVRDRALIWHAPQSAIDFTLGGVTPIDLGVMR